jgi:hypothetical protein
MGEHIYPSGTVSPEAKQPPVKKTVGRARLQVTPVADATVAYMTTRYYHTLAGFYRIRRGR